MMKVLVNYAVAFKLEYGVRFVDASTKGTVDETHSFGYLPTGRRRTYNRFVHFNKLIIKNKKILDPLEALSSEQTTGKSLGMFRIDILALYVLEPDDALHLVEAPYYTTKTKKQRNSMACRFIALQIPYWWNFLSAITIMRPTCTHRSRHL